MSNVVGTLFYWSFLGTTRSIDPIIKIGLDCPRSNFGQMPFLVQDTPSLSVFRRELKTVLFQLSFPADWQVTIRFVLSTSDELSPAWLLTLTESDRTVVLQQKCDNATLIIFLLLLLLPLIQKSSRNGTKARSSHCIIQHWGWTRAGWREGWRGEGLRGVVDHWPVTTRAAHPSPHQWRHPSHVATDDHRLTQQHPTRFHTIKHNKRVNDNRPIPT